MIPATGKPTFKGSKIFVEYCFWVIAVAALRWIGYELSHLLSHVPPPDVPQKHSFVFRLFEGSFLLALIITLLNRLLQMILKKLD